MSSNSLVACCTQNPADAIVNSCRGVHRVVGDREERDAARTTRASSPGFGVEDGVEEQVAGFMCGKPGHRSAQEGHNRGTAMPLLQTPRRPEPDRPVRVRRC